MSKQALERELDRLSAQLGCLWFLPVVGIWMLPIGLATLAVDVPPMRPPITCMLGFINRKLERRHGGERD